MTKAEWVRSPGSKWHKVAYKGPWENRWAKNPDWIQGKTRYLKSDDPNYVPYFKPAMEDRVISACGTLNIRVENAKIREGNPFVKDGKKVRARVCGNCTIHLEIPGVED